MNIIRRRISKHFRKRKLLFSLEYSDKSIENLIFHLKKALMLSINGEFYKEEGGANSGRIISKNIPGWKELKIDVSDFIHLPNVSVEPTNYKADKKKMLGSLMELYKLKKHIYIGEWHIHISGNDDTSREDDINMISKLRFQKYILLLIITKRKTAIGDLQFRVTPYLYYSRWFKKFKWKLEVLDIIIPKNELNWKYMLRYSGNKDVVYK